MNLCARRIFATSANVLALTAASPALANTDPMGNGWFFKLRVSDMAEFEQLMDPPGYDALLKTL